ncbi:hypothetical protein KC19_7G158500 [Ceratodon purpureus]|uniref:Uncharacterized protein n=1 Tax=Ceratodon purpureus TaxID=3225 RepID=A0A8T0H749_CERPU|nr:hypothetical protein KC19_7G158500 [Ceratodon purpureus]
MELYFSSQCENLQLAPQLDGHLDPVSPSLSLPPPPQLLSLICCLRSCIYPSRVRQALALSFLDAHLSSLRIRIRQLLIQLQSRSCRSPENISYDMVIPALQ